MMNTDVYFNNNNKLEGSRMNPMIFRWKNQVTWMDEA